MNTPGGEPFPTPGSDEADIDLALLRELEADREALRAIHQEVVTDLQVRGLNTDMLGDPYAKNQDRTSTIDSNSPQTDHAVSMLTACGAVAGAIHFAQVARSRDISEAVPREVLVEEPIFEQAAYAHLVIGYETALEPHEAAVFRDILNERMAVVQPSAERAAELWERVAKQIQQAQYPNIDENPGQY